MRYAIYFNHLRHEEFCQFTCNELHGVMPQNVELYIATAARISNPATAPILVKWALYEMFIVHRSRKGVPVIQIEVPVEFDKLGKQGKF
jgi:hypothetical protein